MDENQIIIYQEKDGSIQLEVNLREETLWLTQAQIALLFQTERSVITKNLRNVFQSGELIEKSNVQKMHIAHSDKPTKFYSLDAIISVGYRVNSRRATQFRVWATHVLRDYILKGIAVNERQIKETHQLKLKELEKTVFLLQNVMRSKSLDQTEVAGWLDSFVKKYQPRDLHVTLIQPRFIEKDEIPQLKQGVAQSFMKPLDGEFEKVICTLALIRRRCNNEHHESSQ